MIDLISLASFIHSCILHMRERRGIRRVARLICCSYCTTIKQLCIIFFIKFTSLVYYEGMYNNDNTYALYESLRSTRSPLDYRYYNLCMLIISYSGTRIITISEPHFGDLLWIFQWLNRIETIWGDQLKCYKHLKWSVEVCHFIH